MRQAGDSSGAHEAGEDRTLQKAVKEQRVMTVWQDSVGPKADRGKVGFEPGPGRQFLIFPKSLRAFTEHTVFGIKYDLLDSRGLPKKRASCTEADAEEIKGETSAEMLTAADRADVRSKVGGL